MDPAQNRLLASLPESELEAVLERVSFLEPERHYVIRRQGDRAKWVHLPLTGLVSMIGYDADGAGVDVAVVGRDGVVDAHAALVDVPMPTESVQQIGGTAARMPATDFRDAIATLPHLRTAVDRYLAALFVEIAQGSACNRLHDLEPRLARWLLMTAEHVGKDRFALTHELLALMVGSSRPKVSERLGDLVDAGTIAQRRNEVRIVDAAALGERACSCLDAIIGARRGIYRGLPDR